MKDEQAFSLEPRIVEFGNSFIAISILVKCSTVVLPEPYSEQVKHITTKY